MGKMKPQELLPEHFYAEITEGAVYERPPVGERPGRYLLFPRHVQK